MPTPTDYLKNGALRVIEPAISLLARNRVSPNAITTVGTLVTVAAGVVYATGHIMTAGWIMAGAAVFYGVGGGGAGGTRRRPGFGGVFYSPLGPGGGRALLAGPSGVFPPQPLPPNNYIM